MADRTNEDQKETVSKSDHTDDQQFETPPADNLQKKKLTETEVVRAFKEGLDNNSDTDNTTPQQK